MGAGRGGHKSFSVLTDGALQAAGGGRASVPSSLRKPHTEGHAPSPLRQVRREQSPHPKHSLGSWNQLVSRCLSGCDNGELLQYSLDGSHQAAPLPWPSPWKGSGSVRPIPREGQQPPSTVLPHQSHTHMDVWGVLPSEHAVLSDPQGTGRAPRPLWPSPSPGPHSGPRGLCLRCPSWLPPGARRRRSDGASAELPVVCVCRRSSPMRPKSVEVCLFCPSGRAAQPRQDLTRQKNVRGGGGARLPYLAATQGRARGVVAENPQAPPRVSKGRLGWARPHPHPRGSSTGIGPRVGLPSSQNQPCSPGQPPASTQKGGPYIWPSMGPWLRLWGCFLLLLLLLLFLSSSSYPSSWRPLTREGGG